MGLFSNLVDTVGISRNSTQGTPTSDQVEGESGDLFSTLKTWSGYADDAADIYSNFNTTKTGSSSGKAAGSVAAAAAPTASSSLFGLPRSAAIGAAVVVVLLVAFFFFRRK